MLQRKEVMDAWKRRKATAYRSPQLQKADAFFAMVNNRTDNCWDDLVAEFRRNYYDSFDEIVPVMMETDNPLIMYNFARHADFNNPKEVEAAKSFIRNCNAEKHQASLQAMASVPSLQQELQNKPNLPDSVRNALQAKA